jgi:hypothetical protein
MSEQRPPTGPHFSSGLNWKHWLAIIVVLAICCGGLFASCTNFSNPSGAIERSYTRTAALDEGRGKAYTSTQSPAVVASQIADASSPVDERSADGVHYLQYTRHIVAVSPHDGGSKVLLDDYRDGYQRYAPVFLLWGWSSSPPSPFRGGGPGSGK